MATKHDSAAMLPKRKLTTYAKVSRKRQAKTTYQPDREDDDLTPKPTTKVATATATTTAAAATRRRITTTTASPTPSSPSPESESLNRTGKKKVVSGSTAQKSSKSDRKRKFSQVSSKAQTEKPTRNQHDNSPPAPVVSDIMPPSRPSSTQRPRMRSASSEDADIDMVEAKLSSPPPTPTRSKMPLAAVRATPKAGMPFSPNTMQIWDTLLDSEEENTTKVKHKHRQIPVRLAPRSTSKSHPQHEASRVAGTNRQRGPKVASSEVAATPQSKRPRRRLIDALVEQAVDDADEPDTEASEDPMELSQPLSSQKSSTSSRDPTSVPTTLGSQSMPPQTQSSLFSRPALTPNPQAPRRTYLQGIKVLQEDEDDLLLNGFDIPESASESLKGKRLELRGPRKWPNSSGLVDEEDALPNDSPNTKIRDIYELRQAGANTRIADEMQDLAEQIGKPTSKPSSSRRAALLRIAEEIKNKDFIRHFRDHGIDVAIFKDIGKEADVISAYLILSTLATILSKWPSPHIFRLLQEEQIGKVFTRLLISCDDMKKVVQDRKNNLSKRTQSAVLDVQKYLRQLPVWGSGEPTAVSPRTLSIKCLHLLITQEPRLGRDHSVFPDSVTESLLAILSEATEDQDYLDYPGNDESIDLCGTFSVLNLYAVDMASSQREGTKWFDRLLPIVTDIFGTLLRRPSQEDKTLETSILTLTINLTNNNLNAPDICISKDLVPALAGSICSNFSQVLASISQNHWPEGVLDGLVLRLGILINFSEHSVRVRQVTHECQHGGFRPIDEFIRIFLENYRRTAEADSVEKSQLNVAFGYLAVLLGHLCLYAPVRHKFRSSHAAKSMGPLLESIREFVHHHKTVESQILEGEDIPPGQSGWAEIEALARQLEDEAAYD